MSTVKETLERLRDRVKEELDFRWKQIEDAKRLWESGEADREKLEKELQEVEEALQRVS